MADFTYATLSLELYSVPSSSMQATSGSVPQHLATLTITHDQLPYDRRGKLNMVEGLQMTGGGGGGCRV